MVTAYLTTCEYAYLPDLSADDREFLRQRTEQIRQRLVLTARTIAQIGQYLVEVRARLKVAGYGGFCAWLQAEFAMSESAAYRFMNVYERFPELATFPTVGNFENVSPKALYLLAAPSTPYPAVQEALTVAQAGPLTPKDAKEIIDRHKGRDYADPEETRGRRPDETREAIENAQACILNIMRLPQLVFEDGIRTPAQRARLTEIVKLAKEARGYHLEALQALGYKTT